VVSAGSFILSAVLLAALILSLTFAAYGLRRRLLPSWSGSPARLVEAVVGVALLIWLTELLGLVSLLYAGTLVAAAVLLAAVIALGPRVLSRGRGAGQALGSLPRSGTAVRESGRGEKQDAAPARHPYPAPPAGGADTADGARAWLPQLIAVGVVAVVFAHWGLTAKDALGRGIFNFDSLWYHLPFATDIAQTHSVTQFFHPETVFTNWFYPQNSELLHATGILIVHRDTLSLFVNFGWLAIAFLAAWCVGRPYGRGPLAVVAAAIVLESHTLVVREPGAAKNDLMAAALLLAAIALLVSAWAERRDAGMRGPLPLGWPLAAAGLAAGMAVGTKSTAVAVAAAVTVAVVFLAPSGRRWRAFGWWFVPALAGGGYWYLRNLIAAGNPLPQLESLGPIPLPHPERLQSGRPDFSVVHYATDTSVWHQYFAPGLHNAFGPLWPLVIAGAVASGVLLLLWGRTRLLRWLGAVVLAGLLAYLFTPLSAAGAEGAPVGFAINIRYAIPALLAGLTLLPVALARFWGAASSSPAGGVGEGSAGGAASCFSPQPHSRTGAELEGEKPSPGRGPLPHDRTRGRGAWSWPDWALLALLLLVWVVTDRPDAVLRDPDRLFAWLVALLAVLAPAVLLLWRRRGASLAAVTTGFAVLGLASVAIAYPVQRHYLRDRYLNADPETSIPGMHLDSSYRWARGVRDARIGLAGTAAGFLEYGFYGTDLSNRVRYLGLEAPHGAFEPISTCREFRAAVNAADLDYLVTAPFLNFIHPSEPIASPEAGWLRGEPAVVPVVRSGPVTVWKVRGHLDPAACGPRNAPLRRIPDEPPGG
jgi:hypothetical protein